MRERCVEFSFTRVYLSEALEYRELICLLPLSLSLSPIKRGPSFTHTALVVKMLRSLARSLVVSPASLVLYTRERYEREIRERYTDMREALLSRVVRVLRPRVRSHRVASRYVLVRHPHASDMSIDTSTIHLLSFD